jgi:hypothetical protein
MLPKGMTKGMGLPMGVLLKLANETGSVANEMMMATCAEGW